MRWPPYQHVFFDCDSTLTAVEGIDALAQLAGKGWRVSVLTDAAMNGDLELAEVYAKRLQAVKPTRRQIQELRQIYKRHLVPDAQEVISALQWLGHQVYIISGGLAEPVIEFGCWLGVPKEHIRAVGVEYNTLSGHWWQTDAEHERANVAERYLAYSDQTLTISQGKAEMVRELIGEQPGRSLLVGDGVSDLLAATAVELFVGFGGVVRRPRVVQEAPAYVNSASLAPLLALAAGPQGLRRLPATGYQPLATKATQLIRSGFLTFNDERLHQKFHEAYQALYSGA